jgi:hypothetical protein
MGRSPRFWPFRGSACRVSSAPRRGSGLAERSDRPGIDNPGSGVQGTACGSGPCTRIRVGTRRCSRLIRGSSRANHDLKDRDGTQRGGRGPQVGRIPRRSVGLVACRSAVSSAHREVLVRRVAFQGGRVRCLTLFSLHLEVRHVQQNASVVARLDAPCHANREGQQGQRAAPGAFAPLAQHAAEGGAQRPVPVRQPQEVQTLLPTEKLGENRSKSI